MEIFNKIESNVRSYSRSFPRVFSKAKGDLIYHDDFAYLDFLAGAGSLNYGHNHPILKGELIKYIENNGITHGLDMQTKAKGEFLEIFNEKILSARNMEYVVQFTGPTGTNAVEAAFKIARNVTGNVNIIAFTNGFHGVSLGSLAATANSYHRNAAGIPLQGIFRMPFDGYLGKDVNTAYYIDKLLSDSSSGINSPAALVVETIQGEGGVNTASFSWLRQIQEICLKHNIIFIVDDIQSGCGRTGSFFSFEEAGIYPDIVTLSKSLSGYGIPFSLVLMKPHLDKWKPGEHNGTFRGNNHAFITAKAAIEHFWSDNDFVITINDKGKYIKERLKKIIDKSQNSLFSLRGRGMFLGLNCSNGKLAKSISKKAFDNGLIIETSGANDEVLKFLCPLTISNDNLKKGMDIIEESINDVLVNYETRLDKNAVLI